MRVRSRYQKCINCCYYVNTLNTNNQAAISANGDRASHIALLIRCYIELRQLHKAYELLKRGVTTLEELFLLASCYTHMGKLDKSARAWRVRCRAIEIWTLVAQKYDEKGKAKMDEVGKGNATQTVVRAAEASHRRRIPSLRLRTVHPSYGEAVVRVQELHEQLPRGVGTAGEPDPVGRQLPAGRGDEADQGDPAARHAVRSGG